MKLQKFETDNYQAKVDFYFEKEEIDAYFQGIYASLRQDIHVPGFRKGKAPADIAKRYINQERLLQDMLEMIIKDALHLLSEEKNEIDFISPPELLSDLFPEEGTSFELNLLVEFFPEIDLSNIKKMQINPEINKTKNDFEDEIVQSLLETNATFKEIELPPKEGNFALIEYTYDVVSDNPTKQTTMVELGKNQIMPDMDIELMQMQIGEEKVFSHSSDDGKDIAQVKIKLIGLKEKILPELNDDLFSNMNIEKTKDEYLADVVIQAEKAYADFIQNTRWDAFFEAWLKEHTINQLPSNIINHYLEQALDSFEGDLEKSKLTLDEFLLKAEKTLEELKEQFKPKAVVQANIELLIRSIIKNNPALLPSEKEINEETQIFLGKYKDRELNLENLMAWCDTNLRRRNALKWLMDEIDFVENTKE